MDWHRLTTAVSKLLGLFTTRSGKEIGPSTGGYRVSQRGSGNTIVINHNYGVPAPSETDAPKADPEA